MLFSATLPISFRTLYAHHEGREQGFNIDVCIQDFADALMETKKRSLDYCMFPGFRHGELVELPAQLEAPPLLHRITNIQNFNVSRVHALLLLSTTILLVIFI